MGVHGETASIHPGGPPQGPWSSSGGVHAGVQSDGSPQSSRSCDTLPPVRTTRMGTLQGKLPCASVVLTACRGAPTPRLRPSACCGRRRCGHGLAGCLARASACRGCQRAAGSGPGCWNQTQTVPRGEPSASRVVARPSQALVAVRRTSPTGTQGVSKERLGQFSFPPSLTFGIKLEMALSSTISDNHVAQTLADAGLQGWRTKRNNSITCAQTLPDCRTVELVSPVLTGIGGMCDICTAIDAFKPLNPSINKSTDMHVHVGTSYNWTMDHLKNVASNFVILEAGFDELVPKSRRAKANTYCKSVIGQGGVGGTV
ncbi:hypothetical protein FOA52_011448 [Chlamydomonas sp. UWO 241]|nr:hypothetical protein FOA52_011448 [Chlamydomonas sp. UWO 241]